MLKSRSLSIDFLQGNGEFLRRIGQQVNVLFDIFHMHDGDGPHIIQGFRIVGELLSRCLVALYSFISIFNCFCP